MERWCNIEPSKKIELKDGGSLTFYNSFFPTDLSDKLFEVLRDKTPWRQVLNRVGKPFPRMVMWYADSGVQYSYSGVTHEPVEWPFYLTRVKDRVETVTGVKFNGLLLNYYRDGGDSVGFHSDNEQELGYDPVVASVSFGAERLFVIKHIHTEEVQHHKLKHGSLLVMGGTMQRFWVHSIPKTEGEIGGRINLTFRLIK